MAALDNIGIARVLSEVADLLELKNENVFKIRAYRSAADLVRQAAETVVDLDEAALRQWPGIGKDLAGRIREIGTTGSCTLHQDLLGEFPPTLLDLLRLQGIGPKTVAMLYAALRIASLDDLEAAARAGRLRGLKGMGAKKEQLLLRALEERRRYAGRHRLVDAAEAAAALTAWLETQAPAVSFVPVGSLRRGCDTCGDIDVVAIGAGPSVMDTFTRFGRVERILGRGETKASVLLDGGYQADLRLVPATSRGAALQYFTGSKAHNIALRDRALGQGLRLNEYGLFRVTDDVRVAGEDEEGIYRALGLAWVPPELREHRGELEAAAEERLPLLIEAGDLRGDLHMHTTETDGKHDLEAMVAAARAVGLEYIAITDHSRSLAMANGMDEGRTLAHADRVRTLNRAYEDITVLAGVECDILPDGRMDLSDACLAELDVVIASVHSAMQQTEAEMTARLVRAIEHPSVDILGHPTSRLLLRREASRVNMERIADAAAAHGVALEINCLPDRLDLSDTHARLARDRGAKLVINTDAHSVDALSMARWGVVTARRGWLTKEDVLNTRPVDELRRMLRRSQQ
ncbi:MAG: DNA polymerase/3'-5' exonuclease PolX [Vicinamibacterales bacterium]